MMRLGERHHRTTRRWEIRCTIDGDVRSLGKWVQRPAAEKYLAQIVRAYPHWNAELIDRRANGEVA